MSKSVVFGMIVASFVALVVLDLAVVFPANEWAGADWTIAYRPIFYGAEVYSGPFYNPPWTLLMLAPIAIFPATLGAAIVYALNLMAFVFVFRKFRIPVILILLLLFSGILKNSENGNIEGLMSLGLLLPAPVGLFFLLMKPQVGIGVTVYWALTAWQDGGWVKFVRTVGPVAAAYGVSFLIYGNWLTTNPGLTVIWWNTSLWPWSIIPGLLLVGLSIRYRQIGLALAAGPLLSPYVNAHTWAFFWIGMAIFVSNRAEKHLSNLSLMFKIDERV